MILYIVEAHFCDDDSSWNNLLSVRYDKREAEDDKREYEEIKSNNIKLAKEDYTTLFEKFQSTDENDWTPELSQKLFESERLALYDDFIEVRITEVELDKLLYSKEDITYVQALQISK